MKTCPFCLAEIKDDARKCRHCGEWVEPHTPTPPAADSPSPAPSSYTVAAPPAAAPATTPKPCRMCGAVFPPGGVLCLECGYDTRIGRIRRGAGRYRPREDRAWYSSHAHLGRQLGVASFFLCVAAALIAYFVTPAPITLVGTLVAISLLLILGTVIFCGIGLVEIIRNRGRAFGLGVALFGLVMAGAAFVGDLGLGLMGLALRAQAREMQAANNLKQIGIALHNYENAHSRFPPPAIRDKENRPLLSWRVAILPFIEQENLYREFKLDEPWDSEHNKKLLDKMPAIYRIPGEPIGTSATHVQAFVGKGAAFEGPNGLSIAAFQDGTSNTVMVAMAADAVPWTKPDDLMYEPDGPLPRLGRPTGSYLLLFGDGTVRFIRRDIPDATLRALITRAGGEVTPGVD